MSKKFFGKILYSAMTVVLIVNFANVASAEGVEIDERLSEANFERRWELYKNNYEMRAGLVARAARVLRAGFDASSIDALLLKLEVFSSKNRDYLSAMGQEFDKLFARIELAKGKIKSSGSQNASALRTLEAQSQVLGNVKQQIQRVAQSMSDAEFELVQVADGIKGEGAQKEAAFKQAASKLKKALDDEFKALQAVNYRLGRYLDVCSGMENLDFLLGRMSADDRERALAAINEIEHLKYRKLWIIAEDISDIFAEPSTKEKPSYTEGVEFINDNKLILGEIRQVLDVFREYIKSFSDGLKLYRGDENAEMRSRNEEWVKKLEGYERVLKELDKYAGSLKSISEEFDKLLSGDDWRTFSATLDFENRTLKATNKFISDLKIEETSVWRFFDPLEKLIGKTLEDYYGLKIPRYPKISDYLNQVFIPLLDYKIKKIEDFEKVYFARPGATVSPPPSASRPTVPPKCPPPPIGGGKLTPPKAPDVPTKIPTTGGGRSGNVPSGFTGNPPPPLSGVSVLLQGLVSIKISTRSENVNAQLPASTPRTPAPPVPTAPSAPTPTSEPQTPETGATPESSVPPTPTLPSISPPELPPPRTPNFSPGPQNTF